MTIEQHCHELPLTERQQAILRALVRRTPIKQIAFDQGIAPSTVNDHIKAMKRKMGVHSTAELVSEFMATAEWPAAPPIGGATNCRLPPEGAVRNVSDRSPPEALALSDALTFSLEAPWAGRREPRVVPEELDGPDGVVPRLVAIAKIIAFILAAVVLSILALESVDGLIARGVASES